MKSSNKTICLKALVVLSLLSLGSYASAEEYTWETPTFNDWKVMQLSGNQVLPHDALIGNNGTSAGPVPTAIFTKSGEKLELSSENNGKLQVIVRPKPNATPHWLYGIYNYASTTDTTPQQTTELVVKSQLGVDLESAKTQYPGYEELAKAIEVRARGHQAGSPGNNAVSKASFLEDVGIKVVNKTEGAKSPYPTADAVMGLALAGFDGGVVDVSFKKNLSIEGHAETNKNVYGLHMNDQGANGIGSKLSLGGNTFINVASEHGGRAVGMLALAHEANQTITMAETGSLVVKAKQAEGQNFSEAIKFIARGSAGKMSKQHATFGGGVSATANGAYYAVGVGAEVANGSTQNLTFEKGLISSVTANDYSYALKLDGKNAGSDSQVVVKHRLDLMASSTNSSYGIHGETTSGAKNTLTVEGPATITAAHRDNGKYAFGIYSKATTGGVRKISFNNGLTAKASSNTVSSPTVLYTKTDSVQGSVSEIVVDGETVLTALGKDGSKGRVAGASGQGALIRVNNKGNGRVQASGYSYADTEGRIDWNLTTADSYLKGDLYGVNKGSVSLKMDASSMFEGKTEVVNNQGAVGKVFVDMKNQSLWNVVNSSRLTNLTLNNKAKVDMSYAQGFQSLVMENLNGENGIFKLDIDASKNTNNSDKLYVTDTFTGTQFIELNEVGHGDLDGAAGTVLASVKNNNGTFKAVDGEGTLYWNRYELDKKETADTTGAFTIDWYLKKVIPQLDPTTSVETIPAAGALNYYTWRNEFDKLLKRMGELRHNGELEEGVWARVKGAKIGSEQEPGFTNKYIHYEVGYDRLAKLDEKSKRYEGVALAYTDGTSTYRRGDGKNHSLAISFYNTDIRESGHYLDIVCKLSEMNNNFSVFDTKGKNITGETDNLGISLSAEYGRKKDLNHGWYVEPQTQLTLGYLGGDNYTTSNGIHVSQHGIKSAVARIGFNVGKEINDKVIIYAKMNLLHEFGGNYVVDMADSRVKRSLSKDFRDTWLEYGIGAAFALGEGTHAYCDVERSTGSDFNKEWEWNVGIRRNF